MKNDLLDDLSKLQEEEDLVLPTSVGARLRLTALFFDAMAIIVIGVVIGTISLIFDLILPEFILFFIHRILIISLFLFYYPLLESSRLQASIGKFVVSIKVVNIKGERLTFRLAFARFLSNIIACLLFFIGIIMIAFTDHRGMHDMMTDTYVVKNKRE